MFDVVADTPALFIGVVFVFGLIVGSFLNVVIYRLPIIMDRQWREQAQEMLATPPLNADARGSGIGDPGSDERASSPQPPASSRAEPCTSAPQTAGAAGSGIGDRGSDERASSPQPPASSRAEAQVADARGSGIGDRGSDEHSPSPQPPASSRAEAQPPGSEPQTAGSPASDPTYSLQPTAYSQADAAKPRQAFNLLIPRSTCPACGAQIKAWQNVPVLSYLLLRGRCAACGIRISARYPVVELGTAILSAIVAWRFGVTPFTLAALLLTWSLIALAAIDIDHQILPDNITLPLLWLGLIISVTGIAGSRGYPVSLSSAVIGAAAGYLSLWLVFHAFRLLTGKEGMGYGDFKLYAAFGAWLGWQLLPLVILLSAATGAVIGIALIVIRGRDRNVPIPFGPYLAAAGWIALIWGQEIMGAYLRGAGLQ